MKNDNLFSIKKIVLMNQMSASRKQLTNIISFVQNILADQPGIDASGISTRLIHVAILQI